MIHTLFIEYNETTYKLVFYAVSCHCNTLVPTVKKLLISEENLFTTFYPLYSMTESFYLLFHSFMYKKYKIKL